MGTSGRTRGGRSSSGQAELLTGCSLCLKLMLKRSVTRGPAGDDEETSREREREAGVFLPRSPSRPVAPPTLLGPPLNKLNDPVGL